MKYNKANHFAAVCWSEGQGKQESRVSGQGGQAQKRSHGNQCAQKRIGQIAEADEEEQVLVTRAEYDEHLRYLKKTK